MFPILETIRLQKKARRKEEWSGRDELLSEHDQQMYRSQWKLDPGPKKIGRMKWREFMRRCESDDVRVRPGM